MTKENKLTHSKKTGLKIVVRLTEHQAFELNNIVNALNISKSKFIRYILDKAITLYYENN